MTKPYIASEVKAVVSAAAEAFRLSEGALLSKARTAALAEARFAAMLVLHRRGYSYPSLAKATGRRGHTTAIHGVRRALAAERDDPGYRAAVGFIASRLGEAA